MTPKLFLACCLLVVTASGCLVSEQIGEPVGHGRSRLPSQDVTIHFDTDFNRVVLFGRSAALLGIGLWIFSAFGSKPVPIIVGGALIGAAGWFVVKDYPSLEGYRLEVAAEGLTLKVPPDLDTLLSWQSIEGLELEGIPFARIGGETQRDIFGTVHNSAGTELPDWKTMKLTASGQTHMIQLDRLSIEHRQIFANALVKRGGMVKID